MAETRAGGILDWSGHYWFYNVTEREQMDGTHFKESIGFSQSIDGTLKIDKISIV